MRVPVFLYMSVGASANKTQASKRISFPFSIKRIRLHFPVGCEGNLACKIIVGSDKTEPTGQPPAGQDIFEMFGGSSNVYGDGQVVMTDTDLEFQGRGKFIKLYCTNADAVNAHVILACVEIETLKGA